MSKLLTFLFFALIAVSTSVRLRNPPPKEHKENVHEEVARLQKQLEHIKEKMTHAKASEIIYEERWPMENFQTNTSFAVQKLDHYTRHFETKKEYGLAMVRLNIPFTGNEKENGRGKFVLYLDGQLVDNKMYNHESTYDINALDLFGFVKDLKPGKHELTLELVSSTLVYVPYVSAKTWDNRKLENFEPKLTNLYQVIGFH